MAKKKKYYLEFEEYVNFDMIGICAHVSDYRLVWNLNNAIGIHLEKGKIDYELKQKKGAVSTMHSMYEFEDDNNRVNFYLLKNNHQGNSIVPEATYIDYFLFLQNNNYYDLNELVRKLKEVPVVLAAYNFDPKEFESSFDIEFN